MFCEIEAIDPITRKKRVVPVPEPYVPTYVGALVPDFVQKILLNANNQVIQTALIMIFATDLR